MIFQIADMKIVLNNQIMFFKTNEILRFESSAGGTVIYFADGKLQEIDESLNSIETQLRDPGFLRIHHLHIVNTNCITRIANDTTDFVELSNGKVLPINGNKKEIIVELISGQLEKSFEKNNKH